MSAQPHESGSVEAQARELARSSGEWYWDDMAESRRESWRQIIRDAQEAGREARAASVAFREGQSE